MQGGTRRRGETDTPEGNGTGFVWDSDGHVVTNFHVLASALRQLRPNQLQGEGSPKVAKLILFSRSCLPSSIMAWPHMFTSYMSRHYMWHFPAQHRVIPLLHLFLPFGLI